QSPPQAQSPPQSQSAQQQPPVPIFRSRAQLTVVDVTVTDKDGHSVEGLTADDFTLTEDGEPQRIDLVTYQKVDAADRTAPAPGPQTAPQTAAPQAPVVPPAAPPAAPQNPPARSRGAGVAPTVQPTITAPAPGDPRYRNRRLVVLYFDL